MKYREFFGVWRGCVLHEIKEFCPRTNSTLRLVYLCENRAAFLYQR